MYILAVLNKFELIRSASTPDSIKMKMTNFKISSDKPMIVKFKKRNLF